MIHNQRSTGNCDLDPCVYNKVLLWWKSRKRNLEVVACSVDGYSSLANSKMTIFQWHHAVLMRKFDGFLHTVVSSRMLESKLNTMKSLMVKKTGEMNLIVF
jgi:hypothetical protein